MKRLSLLLLVTTTAALLCAPLEAQAVLGKGVRAGVSIAKLTYDSEGIDDTSYKTGLTAGIFTSLDLVPGLTLQPELLYVQKGGKRELTSIDDQGMVLGTTEAKFNVDYLEIPVLVRFSIPIASAILPTLMAGPSLGFKLSSKLKMDAPSGVMGDEPTEQDLDWIKSTDTSFVVGTGFEFGVPPASLAVDIRYSLGMSNINDSSDDGGSEIKNRTVSILAGFSFSRPAADPARRST